MGAERRVRIATDRNAAEGRPYGLYGNAFAQADPDAIRRATTPIDPPKITNLIAMAAPAGGYGRYRQDQIQLILATAFTGFRRAVLESRRIAGSDARVIVHSGFWGCGAFGGNRVLMTLLQLLAAEMAGVDRLVMHVGDASGRMPVEQATDVLRGDLGAAGSTETADAIKLIEAMNMEWSCSNGT